MASSNVVVNNAIVSGEMVPHDIVMQLVQQQILLNRDSDGIVIDGYPRDLNQVQEFETKVRLVYLIALNYHYDVKNSTNHICPIINI